MELFLIRHAQSTNQVLDSRDDIVFDPWLTELGERQAALLAESFARGEERVRFVDGSIDRLKCSPMWRALQTARPLAEALDLTAEVWVDVHEQVLTVDDATGGSREAILAAFPGYCLPEEITDRGWWGGGGESRSECMERAIRVASELWERADVDETLAIVSHARFLDYLVKALLDHLPGHHCWYHHNNTAVSRLALGGERFQVRYLNRLDHLPPQLIS